MPLGFDSINLIGSSCKTWRKRWTWPTQLQFYPRHRSVFRSILTAATVTSTLSLACTRTVASPLLDSSTSLAALQAKADTAQPRDRCFLYAELVNQMSELAGQQFNAGDSERATETLKQVQWYTEKIRTGFPDNSKKLIDVELLMRHASLHLRDILREASEEDRSAVEVTLTQLDQVHGQVMTRVFEK